MERTIKFIPVKHGDGINIGNVGIFGISGESKYLGFKPGRAGKREGWLVVAEAATDHTRKRRA